MGRWLMRTAVVVVVLLAAAQFIRPTRDNPPNDLRGSSERRPAFSEGVSTTPQGRRSALVRWNRFGGGRCRR